MLSPALTQTPPAFDANHAHDLWLQVASEEGLAGEALLCLLLALILYPGLKRLLSAGSDDLALAGFLGAGTALFVQQVVDFMFGVELYTLAAVSLLALYLRWVKAPRLSLKSGLWAAAGLAVWAAFLIPGVWLLRGSDAFWQSIEAAERGDWPAAQEAACLASLAVPDHPLYLAECGLAATMNPAGSAQTAVEALSAAADLGPAWPPVLANLAAAQWQSGDGTAALANLQQAAYASPHSWVFWLSLSRLRACEDQPASDVAFRQAIESNPWLAGPDPARITPVKPAGFRPEQALVPSEQFRWWAAEALALGELDVAARDLQLGLRADPGNANLYAFQAQLDQAQGDQAAARRALDAALFIGASWPYVQQSAAELYGTWGDDARADDYAAGWAESRLELDYASKYFYAVYHTFFLPVDLAPGLIRGGAAPDVLTRLAEIQNSPSRLERLNGNQVVATKMVLDNQALLEGCRP